MALAQFINKVDNIEWRVIQIFMMCYNISTTAKTRHEEEENG